MLFQAVIINKTKLLQSSITINHSSAIFQKWIKCTNNTKCIHQTYDKNIFSSNNPTRPDQIGKMRHQDWKIKCKVVSSNDLLGGFDSKFHQSYSNILPSNKIILINYIQTQNYPIVYTFLSGSILVQVR